MIVVFRVDASLLIGTGHVMRCLALANKLREQKATCIFICRMQDGDCHDKIQNEGFKCILLPSRKLSMHEFGRDYDRWLGCDQKIDAQETRQCILNAGIVNIDWLVIDHYGIDIVWHKILRPSVQKIMCIDDLANRVHSCDLLVDTTLGRSESEYIDLLPNGAIRCTGPKYALLRDEFTHFRKASETRRLKPNIKTILVTMGGVDIDNVALEILKEISTLNLPTLEKILVIAGKFPKNFETLCQLSETTLVKTEILIDVNNMAELMSISDLIIGAPGSTSWERCCLGIPTIQITLADNQILIGNRLEEIGVALTCPTDKIHNHLNSLVHKLSNQDLLASMSRACLSVTDGRGAGRVSKIMWSSLK